MALNLLQPSKPRATHRVLKVRMRFDGAHVSTSRGSSSPVAACGSGGSFAIASSISNPVFASLFGFTCAKPGARKVLGPS